MTNKVASSWLKCLKFNFKRCSINVSYQAHGVYFRPYKDLVSLHIFCFYRFTQSLLVDTWRHFLSNIYSRKQSSHPFDGLSIHSQLLRQRESEWCPILLWGQISLHNRHLISVQILCHEPCLSSEPSNLYLFLCTQLLPTVLDPNGQSTKFHVPFFMRASYSFIAYFHPSWEATFLIEVSSKLVDKFHSQSYKTSISSTKT